MTTSEALRIAFDKHMEKAKRLYPAIGDQPVKLVIVPNMGLSAGLARGGREVHINQLIASQNIKVACDDTIPHEIAHIVCQRLKLDRGHGRNWKRIAWSLGCSGERCMDSKEAGVQFVKLRQRKEYRYIASCNTEVWLSDIMHKKVMNGANRKLRSTGGKINSSHFTGQVRG